MAEDNVSVVRGFYEATNRRDVDAAMTVFAPGAEWHQVTPVPDRSVYRGLDQIRSFLDGLLRDFGVQVEMRSYIDALDHVAALGTLTGRASGLELGFALVHVWRLENGKAVWVYDCSGPDRGPSSVGVRPGSKPLH